MPKPHIRQGILHASSYNIDACSCGSIHFDLLDDSGELFATMTMAPDNVDAACEHLQMLKTYLKGGRVDH